MQTGAPACGLASNQIVGACNLSRVAMPGAGTSSAGEPLPDGANLSFMRVLIVASHFPPGLQGGGPARSTWNLLLDASQNHQVDVVTADRDFGDAEAYKGLSGRTVKLANGVAYYLDLASPSQAVSLIRELRSKPYSMLLLNSFWDIKMSLLPAVLFRLLRGRDLAVVLMPRGELLPESLAIRKWKKKALLPIVRRIYEQTVDFLAATSDAELASLRTAVPGIPAIRTINIPDKFPFGGPEVMSEELRLLFLARISDDKGLLEVLEGLVEVKATVSLTVAGPVQDKAYFAKCQRLVAQLPQNISVSFVGRVERADLPQLFHNHDLFLSLAPSENFGHTIAEALQAGCPVVTTQATPWTGTLRDGGGSVVGDRTDRAEVAATVDQWAQTTTEERLTRRRTAREAYERSDATQGVSVIQLVASLRS